MANLSVTLHTNFCQNRSTFCWSYAHKYFDV